jgi:GTP cyclohydrolase I
MDGVRLMLEGMGENVQREGLLDTPRRVAEMYTELTTQVEPKMTTFSNEDKYDELIVIRGIKFYSLCEHHLAPFFGTVDIGYIPKGNLLGLSKFGRLVEFYARRLQIQERMTQQIATHLQKTLRPQGVGVVVRGEHLCMSMRGIKKPAHETTTSCLLGCLRTESRQEFLGFLTGTK